MKGGRTNYSSDHCSWSLDHSWFLSLPSSAAAAAAAAKLLQSCPTLYNPIDSSPPGSSVPRILEERTLECVAISFSNAWKWKVKVKLLSHARLFATPWTAAYQAPPSMGFSRQEYWSGVPLPSLYPPLLILSSFTQLASLLIYVAKLMSDPDLHSYVWAPGYHALLLRPWIFQLTFTVNLGRRASGDYLVEYLGAKFIFPWCQYQKSHHFQALIIPTRTVSCFCCLSPGRRSLK